MKLTSATDFSFRILIYVGLNNQKMITMNEVSEAYGLSHHHLSKLSKILINNGILEAKRGRDGGVKLAIDPSEITLGSIVRLMEPAKTLVDCQAGTGGCCKILSACRLIGILAESRMAFFKVLDNYTIADLIDDPKAAISLKEIFSQS